MIGRSVGLLIGLSVGVICQQIGLSVGFICQWISRSKDFLCVVPLLLTRIVRLFGTSSFHITSCTSEQLLPENRVKVRSTVQKMASLLRLPCMVWMENLRMNKPQVYSEVSINMLELSTA